MTPSILDPMQLFLLAALHCTSLFAAHTAQFRKRAARRRRNEQSGTSLGQHLIFTGRPRLIARVGRKPRARAATYRFVLRHGDPDRRALPNSIPF